MIKMEKPKDKKMIAIIVGIIVVILIIVIGAVILINKNANNVTDEEQLTEEQEEGEEVGVEITGKAVQEQTIQDYKISNITMVAKQSQTEITLTIKNISSETTEERDIYIKYLNNQNEEIGRTRIHLPKMEVDKELTISTIITKDLQEAADYAIEY